MNNRGLIAYLSFFFKKMEIVKKLMAFSLMASGE
jgi:hypothetical protein